MSKRERRRRYAIRLPKPTPFRSHAFCEFVDAVMAQKKGSLNKENVPRCLTLILVSTSSQIARGSARDVREKPTV